VKRLVTGLLLFAAARGQNNTGPFVDDVIDFWKLVQIEQLHTAVLRSGRVIWQYGKITEHAPEGPVIADRLQRLAGEGRISLDSAASAPPGATIRQVLSNTADGTPGEEVLENDSFIRKLKRITPKVPFPSVMQFASEEHGTLGWFSQNYDGEQILWCHGPSVLLVRVPSRKLTLVVSGDLSGARLEDGNVLRSMAALQFLQDVAKLGSPGADNLIDSVLDLLHMGQRELSATMMRVALNRFPELETTPDVTLLYLFSQLGLPETEASATAVIRDHPSLPTAWFYYGTYLKNDKRYREAAACFNKIVEHQPPWHNWTVQAAKMELAGLQ